MTQQKEYATIAWNDFDNRMEQFSDKTFLVNEFKNSFTRTLTISISSGNYSRRQEGHLANNLAN